MADPYPFKGKVIAITGASRRTGLALTKYLLIRGATVSMCATTADNLATALSAIETEIPDVEGRVMTAVVDIGKLDTVKEWIDKTVERFGKLDGAANVAGKSLSSDQDMGGTNSWLQTMMLLHVNVVGTFHSVREEMRNMKEGGSIVNVGSITSNYASAGVSAYIASKHAIVGLTKCAAFEGAQKRIRVNALCPDMMNKPFNSPNGQFYLSADNVPCITNRLAEPWEVAASIAFLLGDESKFVNKATWFVDGGWVEGNYSSG
ncbi:short chain dehydrogenase family protein [Colletotrichum plurivorum]|uniref:Short chain dehydrogenase family protein n=1 Tax=Colletotrichum plurivorum TaxID=2175906 RepID=A0A8H6NT15_9PEZI|nr:short chain dehydrogenase family protein [Colletotrichum plurivorum]